MHTRGPVDESYRSACLSRSRFCYEVLPRRIDVGVGLRLHVDLQRLMRDQHRSFGHDAARLHGEQANGMAQVPFWMVGGDEVSERKVRWCRLSGSFFTRPARLGIAGKLGGNIAPHLARFPYPPGWFCATPPPHTCTNPVRRSSMLHPLRRNRGTAARACAMRLSCRHAHHLDQGAGRIAGQGLDAESMPRTQPGEPTSGSPCGGHQLACICREASYAWAEAEKDGSSQTQ